MEVTMTDRVALVQQYLKDLIRDADLQISGRKSVLDFAATIRRSTAQEVLGFIQSLSAEQDSRKVSRPRVDATIVPFRSSSRTSSSSATVQ
jgi:hypothetical protein